MLMRHSNLFESVRKKVQASLDSEVSTEVSTPGHTQSDIQNKVVVYIFCLSTSTTRYTSLLLCARQFVVCVAHTFNNGSTNSSYYGLSRK